MSPTQGQAIFLWGIFLSSHFATPNNCMAGYLCPMPNGIFSCHRFPLVWCLTASSLLTTHIWCIWHYFVGNPCLMPLASFLCNRGFQYYSILQCPSYVGHYKYPRSIHPNNESGKTGFCQIIFEFWPQKMGGVGYERVTWSKKRHFLRFFVKRCLTDGYTDFNL